MSFFNPPFSAGEGDGVVTVCYIVNLTSNDIEINGQNIDDPLLSAQGLYI